VPHISTVVLGEIALAPAATAARIVREINKLAPQVLGLSEAGEELAEAYVRAGVVPANKRDDARHVAVATVAGLDVVVSWNHRHLANERKRTLFNAVNRLAGYEQVVVIHTPRRGHAMTGKYETLDDYLNDLDAIKEKVAERTRGMTARQVKAYFARSAQRLRELTGLKLRVRRASRKPSPAKR
jgi:hypothetical protein